VLTLPSLMLINQKCLDFSSGESPPYLLYGDTGKSVIESSAKPSGEFAVIPCAVTNPNIRVVLYKVEREVRSMFQITIYTVKSDLPNIDY